MECRSISLAVIEISQKDIINKNSNKHVDCHLMRMRDVQGRATCAEHVFSYNPYSNTANAIAPTYRRRQQGQERKTWCKVRGGGRAA